MKIRLIWLILPLLITPELYGQSIQTEVSSDSLATGDVFQLHIAARYNPATYEVVFPDSTQFGGEIEYLSSRRFRGVHSRDSLVYTLQFFALQDTVLTSKTVTFIAEDGNLAVSTPEIPLYFKSLLNPEEQNLRPLKPLFDFARSWWLLILFFVLIMLIAFIVYMYRDKLRRKRSLNIDPTPVKPEPFRDPFQHLVNRITHLQTMVAANQQGYMHFYTELSEAFREYVEVVHDIPALESTTKEVIRDLKMRGLDDHITVNMQQILRDSDRVKFANFNPEAEFVQKNYALAELLLKAIKKHDTDRIDAMRYRYEQMLGFDRTAASTQDMKTSKMGEEGT